MLEKNPVFEGTFLNHPFWSGPAVLGPALGLPLSCCGAEQPSVSTCWLHPQFVPLLFTMDLGYPTKLELPMRWIIHFYSTIETMLIWFTVFYFVYWFLSSPKSMLPWKAIQNFVLSLTILFTKGLLASCPLAKLLQAWRAKFLWLIEHTEDIYYTTLSLPCNLGCQICSSLSENS